MPKNSNIQVGEHNITIVSSAKQKSYLSKNDQEMDERARVAVKSSLNKAITCKKPIARYDLAKKKAYLEYSDGTIKYVE